MRVDHGSENNDAVLQASTVRVDHGSENNDVCSRHQ